MSCPFHTLFQGRSVANPHGTDSDQPQRSGRRNLLKGIGAVGGLLALGGATGAAQAQTETMGKAEVEVPFTSRKMMQPFYGVYQSGVLNAQPASAAIVSFDVLAQTQDDLKRLFKILTERSAFLMHGGEMPKVGDKFPPLDSGIVGTDIEPDNLTITVAVGDSLFDERFGLAKLKPKHLKRMEQFPNDALQKEFCHGDLLIQFCSNSPDTTLHALRDIIKQTPDLLMVRWRRDGFISNHIAAAAGTQTPINLLGFKDGTVNPNTHDAKTVSNYIMVGPEHKDEPEWAMGGSYLAARLIRFYVEQWDRTPLQEQEGIFGRDRESGAPLGMQHEHDLPDYAADPEGKMVPLDAHMRLANPREPGFEKHQLLRRAYNYSDNISASGQLDMGLLFLCFQSDLDASFITVQNRLNGEPLEEYISPFGGGYFFVLPGVQQPGEYFGDKLFASV